MATSGQSEPARVKVMNHLMEAQQALQSAHRVACGANALSTEVPAFVEVAKMAQALNPIMQQVAKMRGL